MLAVKAGALRVVELLLQSNITEAKETILIRDVRATMPLHSAVRSGFADIASLLITHGGADALYSENGVGETALDVATVQWLLNATRDGYQGKLPSFNNLPGRESAMSSPRAPAVEKLASEIKMLEQVRGMLMEQGKLDANAQLKDALDSFIAFLSGKLDEHAETSDSEPAPRTTRTMDSMHRYMTFKVVSSSVFASPGTRRLVHLIDVQKSVGSSLETASPSSQQPYNDAVQYRKRFAEENGLAEEDLTVAESTQWQGIVGWNGIATRGDPM